MLRVNVVPKKPPTSVQLKIRNCLGGEVGVLTVRASVAYVPWGDVRGAGGGEELLRVVSPVKAEAFAAVPVAQKEGVPQISCSVPYQEVHQPCIHPLRSSTSIVDCASQGLVWSPGQTSFS